MRAYDDSAGVTAAFNRNVLAVVNRELRRRLRSRGVRPRRQVERAANNGSRCGCAREPRNSVQIADLGLSVDFADGEEMLTEVSCKFTRDGVAAELAAAGLARAHWWTDPAGDFGLSLAVK